MNSTTETANENFITDQGSIRLRFSRAGRGPRAAAPATVDRAERAASVTRAAPTAAAPPAIGPLVLPPPGRCCGLAPPVTLPGWFAAPVTVGRCGAAGGGVTVGREGAAPLPLVTMGTVAEPLATPGPPGRFPSDEPSLSAVGSPGGGAMPGAR